VSQQHPIVPPPELLQLWFEQHHDYDKGINELLIEAAQYGADQELEACCEWVNSFQNKFVHAHDLRLVRRPKPPSLKEQALVALHAVATGANDMREQRQDFETIRRALEALPD
jgi:hypothetical protein